MRFRLGKPNDEEVIARVLAGERDDFGILVERYLPVVRALAYAHCSNHQDADDVTQETFLNAYRSLTGLRDGARFKAWLVSIARNCCRALLRSRQDDVSAAGHCDNVAVEPAPDMGQRELCDLIRQEVLRLDEPYREVLWLHYFAGKKTSEIADLVGLSTEAVKKRLQRGRETLGKRLVARVDVALRPESDNKRLTRRVMSALLAAPPPWAAPGEAAAAASAGLSAAAGLTMKGFVGVALCLGALTTASFLLTRQPEQPASAPSVPDNEQANAERQAPPGKSVRPAAQATGQPALATSPVDSVVVHGTVIDAQSGELIPVFKVARLEVVNNEWTAVGERGFSDGVFELSSSRVGHLSLAVWADGYSFARESVTLVEGGPQREVLLKLSPAGGVSGVVLDARTKQPVTGATVDVLDREFQDEMDEQAHLVFSLTKGLSDAEGRFALDHVASGRSLLTAWHPDYPRLGQPVEVSAGQTADGIRILLAKGTGTIWGYVLLGQETAENARVECGLGASPRQVPVGPGGVYQIDGLAAGQHCIYATAQTNGMELRDGAVAPLEANDAVQVDFLFPQGDGVIEGVFYRDGKATAGQEVEARPIRNKRVVRGHAFDGARTYRTTTDEEGRFRFGGLQPEIYCVTAFVRSDNAGGLETEFGHCWEQVTLQARETVRVDLRHGALGNARVHGVVSMDGEPTAGQVVELEVHLLNGNQVYQTTKRTFTDAAGKYEFPGLREGHYRIVVRRNKERHARTVSVGENETVRVDIPYDEAVGTVTGTVQGHALNFTRTRVDLIPIGDDAILSTSAQPDQSGRYAFEAVPPGRYYLRVRAGGQAVTDEIDVPADGTVLRDLVLTHGNGSLTVTLLKGEGPLAPDRAHAGLERNNEVFVNFEGGADGRFVFDSLAPGEYRVLANVDGILQQAYARVDAGEAATIEFSFPEGTAALKAFVNTGNIWFAETWLREPGHPLPTIDGVPCGRTGISGLGFEGPDGTVTGSAVSGTSFQELDFQGLPTGRYEVLVLARIPKSIPMKTKTLTYLVDLENGQTCELELSLID